ncbi:pyridoxal phosphate homeostasis protein-like [Vitis riparia]|uniref:pyridoxal phosphate homeostasis protein-like n=1 Tax=Vitis riparia TaxID=96939 RepID=UPI00155A1B07|nr:pyridoxal phosphate homeostasis protein-like [Vitis riparia]
MTLAWPLRSVIFRVRQTAERSGRRSDQVRVMAVSRTKPVSHIWQVHDVGHRCFGESYVEEMNERAPQLPKDIECYFIEHLQSNKMKQLLATVLNLAMVEGVNNEKKAFEAAKQLQSIADNLIHLMNGLAVPVFAMSYAFMFVLWARVAAIPYQYRAKMKNEAE